MWIEKNKSLISSSNAVSIDFNMINYNSKSPFRKLKKDKKHHIIISNTGEYLIDTNFFLSVYNGKQFINYNKKTRQSFIMKHNNKLINNIVDIIFDFDISDYQYKKNSSSEYEFLFNNIRAKVLFNKDSNIDKLEIKYKNKSFDISNISISQYIGELPFDKHETRNYEVFDLTK